MQSVGFWAQNPMLSPQPSTSQAAPQPREQHFSSTPRGLRDEVRWGWGALRMREAHPHQKLFPDKNGTGLSSQCCWGLPQLRAHVVLSHCSRPLLRWRMCTETLHLAKIQTAVLGGTYLHGVSVTCHTISLTCVFIVFCKSVSLRVFTLKQGWAYAWICHNRRYFSVGETNYP